MKHLNGRHARTLFGPKVSMVSSFTVIIGDNVRFSPNVQIGVSI